MGGVGGCSCGDLCTPIPPGSLSLYHRLTGGTLAPREPAREAWLCMGKRSAKSRVAALVAVFLACFRDYAHAPAHGGDVVAMGPARTVDLPPVRVDLGD